MTGSTGTESFMGDPNDTIPPPPSYPRPVPRSHHELGQMLVDRHARSLVEWSLEWGHRGYGVEDLVAEIFECGCRPSIGRREDFERESPYYAKRLGLRKRRPGCLPVVVDIDVEIFFYDLPVPNGLEVPDNRGLLESPSAARLAQMERWIDSGETGFVRHLVRRDLCVGIGSMHVVASAPFPSTFRLGVHAYEKQDRALMRAARFPSYRDQIPFFLEPEGSEGWSLIWLAPERLGLSEREVDEALCPHARARYR
jgi:hypothetical protein